MIRRALIRIAIAAIVLNGAGPAFAGGHPAPAAKAEHGSSKAATPPPAPAAPAAPQPPPGPTLEEIEKEMRTLLDLRKRRDELAAQQAALESQRTMIAAVEAKVAERFKELDTLRRRIECQDQARRDREDREWAELVKLYETMQPANAAAILSDAPIATVSRMIASMKPAKAAAILAVMSPDRARASTLTAVAKRAGSGSDTAAAVRPASLSGQPAAPPTADPCPPDTK